MKVLAHQDFLEVRLASLIADYNIATAQRKPEEVFDDAFLFVETYWKLFRYSFFVCEFIM